MNKDIIGLVGFKGSGKGTVGDYLADHHGYWIDSFAAPLKDALAVLFCWPREMLEGDTKESREWREKVDEFWSHKLGIPNFTPRWSMKYFGTELIRDNLHQQHWVFLLEKRLREANAEKIVITDCRFPNEMNLITSLGGTLIRVKQGEEPPWWDLAIQANSGDNSALTQLQHKYNVHPSEFAWIGHPVDYVVNNDGTLEELWQKIDSILIS